MNFGSNDVPPNAAPEIDLGRLSAAQGLDEDEGGGIDLSRYWYAILRHKWLVLAITAVGLGAGIIAATLIKPVYIARAAIQLPGAQRLRAADPTASVPLVDGVGWIELLRSFQVLDDVVRRRHLYLEYSAKLDSGYFAGFDLSPNFVPGTYKLAAGPGGRVRLLDQEGRQLDEVAVGDSLGREYGFRWAPQAPVAPRQIDFKVNSLRDAAVVLGGRMETALSKDGSILSITLKGDDPQVAAGVLNDVITRFVNVATTLKREKLTTVTRVLGEQLTSARADLTAAEAALQSFKVRTITLPSESGGSITSGLAETNTSAQQEFFRMRADRDGVDRDRAAISRALSAAGSTDRSLAVSLSTIGAVRQNSEMTALLTQLTTKRANLQQLMVAFAPGHPQVRAMEAEVAALERQLAQQARALSTELDSRVGEFDQRIGASSREMQQMPVRFTEEARRNRNVQVAQMIYTQLQSSYEQARLAELSAAPDLRLLDEAVPPTAPERDAALQVVLVGLIAGLGLGLALAILLDYFDKRIRYPDQVTRDLGLPILGALPMLTKTPDGQPNRDDVAALLEATRAIRMALLYAHGTAGPFVTTVTSPGPGDGKSFTSANIAKAFASSGRRTILIDADNRRGVLHRAFGVNRKPGLMDLLRGDVGIDEVIVSVPDAGIDFMPTGTRLAAAPEMLSSPTMQQLMMELRARYQAVIIDSPPLGAGIDPLVLASLTGTLVVVLRNGVTDRAFAGARLETLQRLPIRILGAVLNDVRATEGSYRYYTYIAGYRSEDEIASEEEAYKRITSGPS